MSVNLNITPTISLDGTSLYIADYTGIYDSSLNTGGYDSPNVDINSITAVRFLFSSYLKQQNAQQNITTIQSNVEYLVGGTGNFTWDSVVYTVGQTFISMISGTPTLGTCTLSETGNYSPVTTFLPTQVQTSAFSPSLLGIGDLNFPDSTYSVLYEIYTTKYTSGTVPAGTYICGGAVGATITLNSVTYRVGEKFTTLAPYTLTGTGFASLYNASTTDSNGNVTPHYFLLSYYASLAILNLQLYIAQNKCDCNGFLGETLCSVVNKMTAIQFNFVGDYNLDISGTQTMLNEIINEIQTASNNTINATF